MAPKSKLILIMAALSSRKKKICALALMLDKVENEDTGEDFAWERSSQKEKKYGLYHILTDELRLFDKEYLSFCTNDTTTLWLFAFISCTSFATTSNKNERADSPCWKTRFDTEIWFCFYFWPEEISVETNCSRISRNFRRMSIQIYFMS